MQLRCTYCQTMFAISREDMLAGLEHMEENKQIYYDAHCPKCRRANRVERRKLELAYPNWKADIKTMAKAAGSEEEKPAESKAQVPATSGKAPAAKAKVPATSKKTPAAAKKK